MSEKSSEIRRMERAENKPRRTKRNQKSLWLAIGAIFLIILLLLWLTFADLSGDTDVAAFIAPLL